MSAREMANRNLDQIWQRQEMTVDFERERILPLFLILSILEGFFKLWMWSLFVIQDISQEG